MLRITGLIALLFSTALQAQDSTWDTYIARYSKGPGSVLLDMSLINMSPVKSLPCLVTTGVKFTHCTADGFPEADEFPNLYRISDSVQAYMKAQGRFILAGTFTYQCERLDYYYVTDTSHLRKKLQQYYKSRFPGYKASVEIKPDSAWNMYRKFLYPNEEVYEYMQNQKVLDKLERAGDNPEKIRAVDHFLYFKTKEDRSSFWIYASTYGFKLISQESKAGEEYPFSLHITRMDKIDLRSISQLTLVLRREARKNNGTYDGWETVVTRNAKKNP